MAGEPPSLRTRLAAATVAAAFSAADVALTLLGQQPEYWQGRYDLANEANPLARPFLAAHPGWFLGLAAGWWLALVVGASAWRSRWAVRAAAAVVLSHAFGAASWLVQPDTPIRGVIGPAAWPAAVAVLGVAVAVATRLWAWGGNEKAHPV